MMQLSEEVKGKITGHFRMYRKGVLRDQLVVNKPNLILDKLEELVTKSFVTHGAVSDWVIAAVGFGSGTTAPTVGDTALETSIFYAETLAVTHPAADKVLIKATVNKGEGNGGGSVNYSEAALCTNSTFRHLGSRITFTPQPKDSSYAYRIEWELTFTKS